MEWTVKHTPVRRCIVCGRRAPQRDLVRVVRSEEAGIALGVTTNHSGRSAYLCDTTECWNKVLRGNRLADALRAGLTALDRLRIATYANARRTDSIAIQPQSPT